jgi:hypothetical protein
LASCFRVILLVAATAPLSRFTVALVIGADGEDLHVPERGPQTPKGRELIRVDRRSRPAMLPLPGQNGGGALNSAEQSRCSAGRPSSCRRPSRGG